MRRRGLTPYDLALAVLLAALFLAFTVGIARHGQRWPFGLPGVGP